MTIYLIRHGKTLANERRLYCGSTDLGLSEQGREELNRIHFDISNVRFRTSGMKRANETLELLFGPVPYEICRELREVDFGSFEMKSYEQLKEDPAYIAWITGDNMANTPPGGESGNAMTYRVVEAFRSLGETGRDAVVVTHGGVIAAIMEHLFPEENKNRYQWQSANGCGYRLTEKLGQWRYEII